MKASNILVGLLVSASMVAISTTAMAQRSTGWVDTYYSSAAMTTSVGEATYTCAGAVSRTGNTSTPYHQTTMTIPCGGRSGGGGGSQWCWTSDPLGSPTVDCEPF